MKRLAIFVILSFLIIAGNTAPVLSQNTSQESETYILVYDEAHYQYFTSDMMSTALESLNTSLDTEEVDVTVKLVIQKDEFNSTNLQGADLLMITNPGIKNGSTADISPGETRAINNLIEIGGSVLYTSNPISYNQNITGQGQTINDLIFTGFGASVNIEDTNTSVIVDDLNYVKNNTFVKVNSNNFKDQTLVTELNNITDENDNSILYYGSHIQEDTGSEGAISANTSSTAYVLNNNFEVEHYQNAPRWLFGNSFTEEQGRGMIIGSTIMFSDYLFDNSTKWVNQENNLELFQNIAAWLLGITPLPKDQSIVTESFGYFISQNLLYAGLLGLGFFVTIFAIYWKRGRLNPNQIFDIFIEDSSNSGGSSKSKSETSSKKRSQQKSERRKRI